jgi:DNA processing protein
LHGPLLQRYVAQMGDANGQDASGDLYEDDETAGWLALSRVATTGTAAWLAAALHLGSPIELIGASAKQLSLLGLVRRGGREPAPAAPALEEMRVLLAQCRRCGIKPAPICSPQYPPLLRTLDDPPLFLFYRGESPAVLEPCVAVVGSRRVSPYGRRVAEEIGRRLAEAGFCVVSGMALGIDAAAHRGALSRGRTLAVLAGGLDRASPSSHRELYAAILKRGTALSEHPPGTPSYAAHFPIRNRIITGLCPLVIVVEAAERSGSLISARLANEQGREVFAVPGNIDALGASGTNRLIRDGCTPLVDVREMVAEATEIAARYGLVPRPGSVSAKGPDPCDGPVSSAPLGRVLATVNQEPADVDSIARAVGFEETEVMTLLTTLELDGLVERLAGGTFVRASRLTPR